MNGGDKVYRDRVEGRGRATGVGESESWIVCSPSLNANPVVM